MDIQIRKQLEQLEYIKDKLEYIEYDEALGCYIEKQDGLPTGVAAWVNGAFYGFEQAAKAQAVQKWISVEDNLPNRQANVLVASKHDFVCIASLTNNHKNNKFYDGDGFAINSITHWMPLPKLPKAQEQADAL